ncbi:Predicted arabinose efflux permease, MFS family [Franzmannia pantelleriensis]|uniref:Predicted arabinose efflux permease, MFS family n=1 Tax=Franzmannia pantelleriensis TaxID=48727 RepID=A0A1G9I9D6_9GAMM|nr:MFS transporter [Halomonas pantelleriensis]SDL21870.1 Predicted arabinose efflux permease, MFS family [Halomonas pantelleriensis]
MRTLSNMGFALFGAGLIAISYGLARFAFGLFVPSISDELELTAHRIGIIGSLPFISFVLATLVAPLAADRLGARNLAVLSGSFGAGGLTLISQASDALSLGVGVFICGICTGLMMPALTSAMQALVSRTMHGRVSSIMNAGTSIGIIVAVPTVVFLFDAWRFTYAMFAVLAGIGVVAAWFFIPSVSRIIPANAVPPEPINRQQWSRLIRLTLFAFTMGFVSAPYWLFAPDLAVTLGALSPGHTGWLWFAVGVAGLGGAMVSDLADRNNPPITQALMLMMLASSLALLAASPGQLGLAMFSALVFGLAYMSLTGLYLMTGIRLLPGRLSVGPVLPFMAVALGQAAGSPVIGALVGRLGYAEAFSVFAMIGILASMLSPIYPGHIDYWADWTEETAEDTAEEEPEAQPEVEETGLQAAYDQQLVDENGDPVEPAVEEDETTT